MTTKERPLSPHLTIYKPQISSLLSILHRMASFISFVGLITFAWWAICAIEILNSQSVPQKWILTFFNEGFGKILMILWTYPFVFYLCTEIRYMLWSFDIGFEIKEFTLSGYIAIFASILLWGVFWFMMLV